MWKKIAEYFKAIWEKPFWTDLAWLTVFFSWLHVLGAHSVFPLPDGNNETRAIMLPMAPTNFAPLNVAIVFAMVICLVRKAYAPARALVFGITTFLLPLFYGTDEFTVVRAFIYVPFIVSFLLSMYSAVRNTYVYNWPFILFLALALIEAIIAEIWALMEWNLKANSEGLSEGISFLLPGYKYYCPSLINVVFWCSLFFLAQVLYLSVKDNRAFFREIATSERRNQIALQTLKLWFIFPAIFVVLTFGYNRLFNKIENIYVDKLKQSVDHAKNKVTEKYPEETALLTILEETLKKFDKATGAEAASKLVIEAQVNIADARFTRAAGLTVDKSKTTVGDAKEHLYQSILDATPDHAPGTSPRGGCSWHDFKCHFMSFIKGTVDKIYQSVRNDILNDLNKMLEKSATDAQSNIETFGISSKDVVSNQLKKIKISLNTSLTSGFEAWRKFSWIMLILSMSVLIKTLLMVMGRVVFNKQFGFRAKICSADADHNAEGQIQVVSGAGDDRPVVFQPNSGSYYIITNKHINTANVPQAMRFPHMFAAPVRRLFVGAYQADFIDMDKQADPAKISVPRDQGLVEWHLDENQRVFIEFRSLAAFSKTVRFGKIVSFGIASLAFGRIIHYYIEGPGIIVLRTNDTPVVTGDGHADASYRPECFVAMDTGSSFEFYANLKLRDILISGYQIKKHADDSAVIDRQAAGKKMGFTGILKECWQWLLPV